jgi:hypothetical protein
MHYHQQIFDRIWTIWEGTTAITSLVKVGNRLKMQETNGWLKATMMSSKPADLPSIRLEMPRTIHAAWEDINTFDVEEDDFNEATDGDGNPKPIGGGPVKWTFNMKATFLSVPLKIFEQDPLVELAIFSLLSAGPGIGLPFVLDVGPFTTDQVEIEKSDTRGVKRLRTEMTFPIVAQFEMRDLVQELRTMGP